MITDKTYLSNLDSDLKEKMNEKSLEVYAYIWTVIVLSALALDICCIKWRSIAKLFLPIELVILFFVNLVQL